MNDFVSIAYIYHKAESMGYNGVDNITYEIETKYRNTKSHMMVKVSISQ